MMKPNMRINIALILAFGVVLLALGLFIKNNTPANPKPTEDWRMKDILALEQEMEKANLTEKDRESLKTKLQALYYQVTLQAIGANQLTKMPTEAQEALQAMTRSTLAIEEKRNTGILENPSVPFPTTDFVINNAWQNSFNGNFVIVFAGSMAKDPVQGVLIVCLDSEHECRLLMAPQKNGSIRIVGFITPRLILRQLNSDQDVFFDISTFSFLDTLESVVITDSPTEPPRWKMYEAALLKATVRKEDGVCEWVILGATKTEVYVYTICQLRNPPQTAMSVPAVVYLGENGEIQEVTIPRDGVFYPQDIKALFPLDIQKKILTLDFGETVRTNDTDHLQARLKAGSDGLAPLIVVLGTPMP
jgi:hypothetical protein